MMIARSKKPTLEQVRTLFPFDVPTLASKAGVLTDTVYYALQHSPILEQDAEKIIIALSQQTGLHLTLEQVDIVVLEEFLLLWSIRASSYEHPPTNKVTEDHYHFVYAQDQQHAATLSQEWLKQYPTLPYHSFTACPEGFTIGDISVPGHQQKETEG
jgi:hypothetical protein